MEEMQRRRRERLILLLLLLLCLITLTNSATVTIPVGVLLDLSSSLGSMARNCTNIALHDFYSTPAASNHTTRLQLHFRDSGKDLVTAAFAAQDLINNETVHAILGPQNSEQAMFIVELGYKYDVPVIWFSPSGPSLLPPRSRFFINSNSSRGQCFQFNAIAAIIGAYNWQSVIPIYEDPEFGNDLIPCLTYALQDMDTRVPYISAISQNFTDEKIIQELKNIKGKRTYVFLAHMTVGLWSRLVKHAQNESMMGKGYAWILTQGLSSVVDPEAIDKKAEGYMDGALGVRPVWVLSNSTKPKLASLAETLWNKYDKRLSLYGLWAYDTITALANAVENSNRTGENLRTAIQNIDFRGLSGNFSWRQGQLEPSEVVVYNVKGPREITIGYWSPERGFHNRSGVNASAAEFKLRDPTWPGNTEKRPPKLKIGVPKTHFPEFVDVITTEKGTNYTGLAVDVFRKVVDVLSFNLSYEFVPLNNTADGEPNASSYDNLLCDDITNKDLVDADVIIGDITIVENRATCVDFTMPYLDSSLSMVVKVMSDDKNGWILLKPFHWLLWLILLLTLGIATVTVILLERNKPKDNDDFKHFIFNPFLLYKSDVEGLKSGTSKWLVIGVTFLFAIAIQLYTANLTSMLSERTTAKPSPWRDLQEIKRNNKSVGYQRDSWVKDLLINQIGLEKHQLKPLGSLEEYQKEISNKTGGVDAIFDETPYLMLLISKCPSCKITGPIYKAGGFAFAFRKNSTLVSSFSAAILNVTQNVTTFRGMGDIDNSSIPLPITVDKSEYKTDVKTRSLKITDFGGYIPWVVVWFVLGFFFIIFVLKYLNIYGSLVAFLRKWFHCAASPA